MKGKLRFPLLASLVALATLALAVWVGWAAVRGDGRVLRDASVADETITPNADGESDVTTISYELADNATVSIYFQDDAGERYYFRRDEPRGAGSYQVNFSGVVEGYRRPGEPFAGEIIDRLLQDGAYTWIIAATADGEKETAEGRLRIRDADDVLPELRNFSVDRDVFTPNRDGISDRVQFEFDLPKEADVSVYLLLPDDTRYPITERPMATEPGKPGRHIFEYTGGVDEGSAPPPDGTYQVRAIAEDKEGQKVAVEESLTIQLGGVPFAKILSPVTGDTIAYNTTAVEICDTLFFTMTVENYGSTPIRTTGPWPGAVYDSDWNYNTIGWPTESGAWRVGLGYENALSDYPYRWGLGTPETLTEIDGHYYLMPGQRSVVNGAVRVVDVFGTRNPQPMWGGLIHEDVEITLFNNRVDPRGILVDVPDQANMPQCEERPVPSR